MQYSSLMNNQLCILSVGLSKSRGLEEVIEESIF